MISKQAYIDKAASWVKAHGFVDIKANADGYPKPTGYGRQQDGQSFVPDITGLQSEHQSYFEVILKTTNISELVSKLQLLHQLTSVSGGQLYLMAPKGHMPFAKSVVADNRIAAEIINLV